MNRDEIEAGVRQCVREALTVDRDGIRLEDRLIGDLGLDSLDLLDLTFRLQQKFRVTISPRDIERRAKAHLGEIPFEVDGVYTREALAELRKVLPEIPPDELGEGLTVSELPRRLRVATMVNLVARLLEETDG